MRYDLQEALRRERRLGIVRTADRSTAIRLGTAVLAAGWSVIEVSLTTPDAHQVIQGLSSQGRGIVGAGTVRSVSDAERALSAGAQFIVSPGLFPGIGSLVDAGISLIPWVCTPTEMMRAADDGVTWVKLFPAASLGPSALRAIREPLPDINIVAVGGIGIDNARLWLDAGAAAIGIAGGLLPAATSSYPVDSVAVRRHLEAIAKETTCPSS